jgi:hypothetical protein
MIQVKRSQQDPGTRLKAHHLSNNSQNNFLESCGDMVRKYLIKNIKEGGFYSVMVDATPDTSHIEQQTFIIRYLSLEEEYFVIKEVFLEFADCCEKTGEQIATLIFKRLKHHGKI